MRSSESHALACDWKERANPPGSTLVEVSKLVSPEYLVEITAVAVTSG